ncbi:ABC transporter substrate-binding protein [Pararhizobium sp. YC-54]|uniref:ABC transporter substrate-binding protein n=1 Tax=Pararhizobium sp. YC-54 TaxID=2986920 RepID=UPI0021F7F989|nr:ABC transporter substrate-binding protein [Pararhizobium sp. YC-54]MCV9999390.1 ABC transporter substrate-binding protein [Pararhizobium sp. YC-54]
MKKGKTYLAAGISGLLAVAGLVPHAHAANETVTVVLPEEPPSLEPCESKHSSVGRVLIQNITEPLTVIDPQTGEVKPELATRWEQTAPDAWRFYLREGVKFSDGAPFDAKAVAASIERLQRTDMTCNTKQQTLGGVDIKTNVVNDYVVEFKTSKPIPIFPTMMTVVQMSSPNMTLSGASRNPIGTGPYVITAWNAGTDITVERRDDYWGEKPVVSGARYVWRSESALRAAMVATGEADLTPIISVADADNPETDLSYPNGETTRLRISTMVPPLDDKRVRLALNLAIDREGLKVLFGEGAQLSEQLVGPNVNGFNPDIKPFAYDPEKAKQLVAEAKADGVPVDKAITIIGRNEIYVNAGEALEAMQAMWSEIGLNTQIRMFDTGNWLRYQNKPFPEPDMANLHQDQHDNLLGDATFTTFNKYDTEGVNSAVSDKRVDDLIAKAEPATGETRTKAFQEAFALLHDDIVADVYMYHMVGYTRVNPRLDWRPTLATNSEIDLSSIRFRASE